jgi:hypothetical protein
MTKPTMYIIKQRDPRAPGYDRHPYMVIRSRGGVAVSFEPTREAAQARADSLNAA